MGLNINESISEARTLEINELKQQFINIQKQIIYALDSKIFSFNQLNEINNDIEKMQAVTSQNSIRSIKESKYTAAEIITWQNDKIFILTSDKALSITRPFSGSLKNFKDTIKYKVSSNEKQNVNEIYYPNELSVYDDMDKIKALICDDTINAINREIYTKKSLLECNAEKIKALTDPVILKTLEANIYNSQTLLKMSNEELQRILLKTSQFSKIDSLVEKLGKVFFYALQQDEISIRKVLELNSAESNNDDNLESPLSVALHNGSDLISGILIAKGGHLNHYDFATGNNTYIEELKLAIDNSLSKNELLKSMSIFSMQSDSSKCLEEQFWEGYCLIDAKTHTEL